MTNLLDVANVAPNVTMFESSAAFGKTNSAFIRGIGSGDFNLAAAEPGVGVYIDDVYFATLAGFRLRSVRPRERRDRARATGQLQGKNSIGGAVNMHSKKPTGDGTGFIDVTMGDYGRRDFKAAYDMSNLTNKQYYISYFERPSRITASGKSVGSDFPLIAPDRWIKDLREAGFKPEIHHMILKENAITALSLA